MARASATSTANAYSVATSMILRDAVEVANFPWREIDPCLPKALMSIMQRTGIEVRDPSTGAKFPSLHLLRALDFVFGAS